MDSPVQKNTTPIPKKNSIDLVFWGTISIFITSLLGTIQKGEHGYLIPNVPAITLGFILGTTIIALTLEKIDLKIFKQSIFVLFNAFGLLIFFSTFYSKYPSLTASRSLQLIIVLNCLYFLINQAENTEKLFRYISYIAITFSLIACIYALTILYLGNIGKFKGTTVTQIQVFGFNFVQAMSGARLSAFLGNPNFLGIHLMFSVMMSLYLLTTTRKAIYLLFILIFLYVLMLSGSRASIVGLTIGVVFFISHGFIKENTTSFIFRFVIFSAILLCAILLYSSPEILNSISLAMGRKTSTLLSGRENAWDVLIEQAKTTPIAGIGYRISTEAVLIPESINVNHSHNIYLATVTESGIIGLSLLALMYFSAFYYLSCNKKTNKNVNVLSNITLSILLSFLVNQFFEDMYMPLYYYFITSLFCLFIGIKSLNSQKHN